MEAKHLGDDLKQSMQMNYTVIPRIALEISGISPALIQSSYLYSFIIIEIMASTSNNRIGVP